MPQIAIPIAAAVVGAGAGALFNKALAPKPPKVPNYTVGSVTSPGFNLTKVGRGVQVTRGAEAQDALSQLRTLAAQQGGALGSLLNEVRPGFSALRSSRLTQLGNARRRAIGNLRENLARRRLSGSSFANDSLLNAEAGFAELQDQITAETTLQELDAYNKILTQRYNTLTQVVQNELSQLNAEATLGANFANGVQSNLTSIFNTQAQLAAQGAAGAGAFAQPAVSAIQTGVTDFLTGLTSSGSTAGATAGTTTLSGNYSAGFT